jgi:Uma2 family endonuclease
MNLNLPRDWTVDDVASLPDDLSYELIDGDLHLPPSPTAFHQLLVMRVAMALDLAAPDGFLVSHAQSVLVDDRNEPRPDVVVLRAAGANRTPVPAADVVLAVEIISPESSVRDREDKMNLYALADIPAYWIIDPLGARITFTECLLSDAGTYHQHVRSDGLVTIDCPWETTLDMRAWTEKWADLSAAARPNG